MGTPHNYNNPVYGYIHIPDNKHDLEVARRNSHLLRTLSRKIFQQPDTKYWRLVQKLD